MEDVLTKTCVRDDKSCGCGENSQDNDNRGRAFGFVKRQPGSQRVKESQFGKDTADKPVGMENFRRNTGKHAKENKVKQTGNNAKDCGDESKVFEVVAFGFFDFVCVYGVGGNGDKREV